MNKRTLFKILLVSFITLPSCSNTYRGKSIIYWQNYDGTILESKKVKNGTLPSYEGEIPSKQEDQQYTYTFSGWSPSIEIATESAVYTATYTNILKQYSVSWNVNGNITTELYNYGDVPSFKGDMPNKPSSYPYFYTFGGWAPEIAPVNCDITYTAIFNQSLQTFTITWQNYDGEVLEVDEGMLYGTTPIYNGETPQKPREDKYTYTFDNWSPEVSLVTEDTTYVATYNSSVNYYRLTFDANGGYTSTSYMDIAYDSAYTLPTPYWSNHEFLGWFYNNQKVENGVWQYNTNITVQAKWNEIYPINYILNGGTNDSRNPSSYTVDDQNTLYDASRTGYTFLGWFDNNGNQITQIIPGMEGALTLNANWSVNNYLVSIVINNEILGSVSGGGTYAFDGSVTLTAMATSDNVFKGWYSNSDFKKLLSTSNPYSFDLESEGLTVYAKFFTREEEEQEVWDIAHGVIPKLSEDGKKATYGLYPQTNVSDSSLISLLNALTVSESNGWYLYNDEYYAKIIASPKNSSCKFNNGSTIVNGKTYWFKCELIVWDVLWNNDGECFLLSNVLIDERRYNESYSGSINGHYSNNYEFSEIRNWLNNEFFNSAFQLGNSYIQSTVVDNSGSSTDFTNNSYACSDTLDKVFLLSYQDYINLNYGFSTSNSFSETRYCKTTDWSRARGASYYEIYDEFDDALCQYNGMYWTRSPSYYHSGTSSWFVGPEGNLSTGGISYSASVRPALIISLEN